MYDPDNRMYVFAAAPGRARAGARLSFGIQRLGDAPG